MKILRVLNNNVVLARPEGEGVAPHSLSGPSGPSGPSGHGAGHEAGGALRGMTARDCVILTGSGVGFQKKPGQQVDMSKVRRVFVPEDNRNSDHLGEMLAGLPVDLVDFVAEAAEQESADLQFSLGTAAVVAMADHLNVAIQRAAGELPPLPGNGEHPLQTEIIHLYPAEVAAARRILGRLNAALPYYSRNAQPLPDSEAISVAMHIVNAGFMTGDLSATYEMTGVFSQLFDIIESCYGRAFDRQSLSAARFITHMRYFFVRAARGEQLNEGMSVLADSLATSHPEATTCAARLAAVLELRLGVPLTEDEQAYLALHVARLAQEV